MWKPSCLMQCWPKAGFICHFNSWGPDILRLTNIVGCKKFHPAQSGGNMVFFWLSCVTPKPNGNGQCLQIAQQK